MSTKIQNKIRTLREMKNLSQEQMAECIHMSKNGYGKMERGESRLTYDALQKIASVFEMDVVELINLSENGLVCLFSENNSGTHYGNFYQGEQHLVAENEKLQLIIKHKDELIAF